MAFFDILLNPVYIISLLIQSVVAFVAIVAVNKILAHNFEPKHSFIMALIALFITPIIGGFVFGMLSLPSMFIGGIEVISGFILPLLVWIVLGELMLQSDKVTKLKVLVVAFIVYLVLSIFVTPAITGLVF